MPGGGGAPHWWLARRRDPCPRAPDGAHGRDARHPHPGQSTHPLRRHRAPPRGPLGRFSSATTWTRAIRSRRAPARRAARRRGHERLQPTRVPARQRRRRHGGRRGTAPAHAPRRAGQRRAGGLALGQGRLPLLRHRLRHPGRHSRQPRRRREGRPRLARQSRPALREGLRQRADPVRRRPPHDAAPPHEGREVRQTRRVRARLVAARPRRDGRPVQARAQATGSHGRGRDGVGAGTPSRKATRPPSW